jgi:iron complex transport system permease protein
MLLGTGTMQSTQVGAVSIANPYLTTVSAFIACMVASLVIIAIARLRGASPEVMVLSGVALGSLFSAGTMFLQYFADDVQLAAMVFWTFGDVGRAGWPEVGFMAVVVAASCSSSSSTAGTTTPSMPGTKRPGGWACAWSWSGWSACSWPPWSRR